MGEKKRDQGGSPNLEPQPCKGALAIGRGYEVHVSGEVRGVQFGMFKSEVRRPRGNEG